MIELDGGKTIRQLKKEAMHLKIKGYYNMRKKELVEAISKRKTELAKMAHDIGNMKMSQLRSFAKEIGLRITRRTTKSELIEKISNMFSTWEHDEKSTKQRESKKPSAATSSLTKIPERKVVKTEVDLPKTYKKDKLVGLEVNTNWLHFYWDLSEKTRRILSVRSPIVLRVYDVTYIDFNGTNAHRTFEMELNPNISKYYVFVPQPNADYLAEIGYKDGNKFVPLLRSNLVTTPPSSPRLAQMELWMDLRTRQKFSEISSGKFVTRVEKLAGVSSMPTINLISGGGSFFWLSGRRSI